MHRKKVFLTLIFASLIAPFALSSQKDASSARSPNKSVLAEEDIKKLLLLMDTNKNGKISKQEWMRFMEAEFDRLDKDKSGELDPKELTQSRVSVRAFRYSDQGK